MNQGSTAVRESSQPTSPGKPYVGLFDAAATRAVFEFENTTGLVVGFYTPEMAEGMNVPWYHLHYLSAVRTE